MMRRLFALAIAAAITLSLTACGSTSPTAVSSDAAVSSEAAAKKPSIGLLIYKYEDTYISTVRDALQTELSGKAEVTMQDGMGDQATQNGQLDAMLQSGVDVLCVNMVDAKTADVVVGKAKAAGIPTVFFNREPDAAVIGEYDKACFVGTNAADAGKMQGDLIKQIFASSPERDLNGDGKVQYVMLQGEPDNPEARDRTEWSIRQAESGGVTMKQVGRTYVCNWDAEQAQRAMEGVLAEGEGQVELVIANNDEMALGAIAALSALGYNTGEGDKFIPVIGVDATDKAKAAIEKGTLSATVVQDAAGMAKAVAALALNAAEGRDFLDGTEYEWDESGVAIRIPYAPYSR